MRVRTTDGDTVGLLTWRLLGRDDDTIEEQVYQLNPHLHDYGLVLPAGVVITLPEVQPSAPKEREGVWS
ncbi:tail protein X [Aeromonas caviae]|jgi:phage tail protein X